MVTTVVVEWTPEQLTALQGSIAKWQAIYEGTEEDRGSDNCPCCVRYLSVGASSEKACTGCPVAISTGLAHCDDTPYIRQWLPVAYISFTVDRSGRVNRFADTPERKAAALAELNFLKSLLPREA